MEIDAQQGDELVRGHCGLLLRYYSALHELIQKLCQQNYPLNSVEKFSVLLCDHTLLCCNLSVLIL
jgi:hypothetical protein